MDHKKLIAEVRAELGVGYTVADELLVLAGDDKEMTCECSLASPGLDQCKAAIINQRFSRIEKRLEVIEDALFEDED
jgi:hypothetical protein